MSIQQPSGSGQLSAPSNPQRQAEHDYWLHRYRLETYKGAQQPAIPLPPEAQAKVRAYWGNLFKAEIEALNSEWAEQRAMTPITQDLSTMEDNHVSVQQAS